MHYLVILLFGGLARFIPSAIARVLVAFGIGAFVATSLTAMFNIAKSQAMDWWSGTVTDGMALAQIAGVQQGMIVIISAVAVRVAWQATAITIKKL